MSFGTLIHTAVLEPELFAETVLVTDLSRSTKAFKELAAAPENEGATIIKSSEMAALMGISKSVHGNPEAHRIIEATQHEVSLFWDEPDIGPCKCRCDCLSTGILADVKSMNISARDTDGWVRDVNTKLWKDGIDIQAGWYLRGARANDYKPHVVAVIVCMQKEPYEVTVKYLQPDLVNYGWERAQEIAMRYHACEIAGSFPGVADQPTDWELPAYAKDDGEQDISTGTMEVSEL